uniref:Uncharacterized protein n=1 Tax=uncultured marine virus TaxID=186617 RepID=S4TEH3_9VIRU|nr:hypothetical protein [uncultured marine virus]
MAAKKAQRIDDCQRTLSVLSPSTSVGTLTAHVPDLLMRANRRQYEQCRAYDVSVQIVMEDSGSTRNYEIYTLSNAWWVKRSIEMAKGVYLDATKKERMLLAETGRTAKWGDFIISCATGAAGNFADLVQYSPASSGDDMTAAEVASDESIYEGARTGTDLKDDDGDNMGFSVLGADQTGPGVFNIFDEYLLTRQHVSPADTRAGPYADLLEIDEDAMLSLKGDGDQAPYDLDAFPSPFVMADSVGFDGNPHHTARTVSKTFTAPLGIVIIKKKSLNSETNFLADEQILIHARKGTYKGVHAPAYRAMKGLHSGLA